MAERRRSKPEDSVYTVLIGIALFVLICGIGYVWYRSYQLTGSPNPFTLEQAQAAAPTLTVNGHHV
jgi:cytochrome c-type biogenesis protein CcmH/NrfG